MSSPENVAKRIKIEEAFRPYAPIDNDLLFAGRTSEIERLLTVIIEKGRHAILYGERGVGKTSLANIVQNFIPNEVIKVTVTCARKDTFSRIWYRVLDQIPITITSTPIGFAQQPPVIKHQNSLAAFADPDNNSPDDIRLIFQRYGAKVVVIIDEIDKIENPDVLGLLADTVKTLSDHVSPATLILVGVASSVDDLIEDHQSISRALQQVQMDRMADSELREALHKSLKLSEMEIDEDGEEVIIRLSSGLPSYTHLLGKHSALIAISSSRDCINHADVHSAIERSLDNTEQTVLSAYTAATERYQSASIHRELLLACAMADINELGWFSSSSIKEALLKITGERYEVRQFARILSDYCTEKRGNILQRDGKRKRYKYRFDNPLMQPYIIMRGIRDGLIDESLASKQGKI